MSNPIRDVEFQNKAVDNIIASYELNSKARVLLVQPTGTGKTVVASKLIIDERLREVLLKDTGRDTLRIIYKCHIRRLITQAERRFDASVVTTSSLANWANPEYVPTSPVEVVYQMYSEKITDDAVIDLIIYDECHHEACNTIQEFLETAGKFPSLGMTATPDRGDNCLIKFDYTVNPISREDAVEQGYICSADINTIVDSSSKNKVGLLKEVLKKFHAEMNQTMIFVRTKNEINEVVDFINNEMNMTAMGCGDEANTDELLDSFSAGEYRFIVSANKISEGVDCKGVTDVIVARNVGSNIILNQIIGRAARPDVNICRVWEFVNSLASNNISAVEIVGLPKSHRLISKKNGEFVIRDFM